MKKTLLILLLSFNLSQAWAFDSSDEIIQSYNEKNDESKESIKQRLKDVGWHEVTSSDEKRYELNYNYIKNKSYGIVEAWTKAVIINDIAKDGLSLGDYSMELSSFDCSNDQVKFSSVTHYNHKTNAVINSITFPDYRQEYSKIIPNSVGEHQLVEVCRIAYIKAH